MPAKEIFQGYGPSEHSKHSEYSGLAAVRRLPSANQRAARNRALRHVPGRGRLCGPSSRPHVQEGVRPRLAHEQEVPPRASQRGSRRRTREPDTRREVTRQGGKERLARKQEVRLRPPLR